MISTWTGASFRFVVTLRVLLVALAQSGCIGLTSANGSKSAQGAMAGTTMKSKMKIRRAALLFYFLPFLIVVPARAVTHYYVTTNGRDTNPCSQPSPCLTVQHVIEVFVLDSDGAVIHVAAGTYTDSVNTATLSPACEGQIAWFCANRGGTSDSVRLTIQCDASAWPTWSGGGCVANPGGNGSSDLFAEFTIGQYVTLKGFEYGNHPGAYLGILGYARSPYPVPGGNYITVTQNYLHDVGQTANSGPGGVGCPSEGMIVNSYPSTGWVITQNKINHFGDDTLTHCNQAHGIYGNGNIIIQNNIIGRSAAAGISYGYGDCGGLITNNVIFDNRLTGIFTSWDGTSCSPLGYNTITNNIFINNSSSYWQHGAIDMIFDQTNTTSIIENNMWYGNTGGPCDMCVGTVTGNIASEGPSTTFVNFRDDGTGNYNLKAGSVAINGGTNNGAGSPGCASACAPTVDFAGNSRPTPPNTNVD